DESACTGQDVSFASEADGVGPFHYQWRLDGSSVGTNGPTLTVATAGLLAGSHTVEAVVSGQCGPALTNSATLTVQNAFAANGPEDTAACQGTDAKLLTTASGTGPFTYQWSLDAAPVGTNGPGLTVPTGAMALGNHSVQVIVSGQCAGVPGTVTNTATLNVNALTSASVPSDATICQGGNAGFSTVASGTGPFTYEWILDGVATGTNGPSLSVPTGSLSLGAHTAGVAISGLCGSVTNSATLTVQEPTSASGLSNATVCTGTDANFSTTASGTGPFNYAWTFDDAATGTNDPGLIVTTGSLTTGTHTVRVVVTGQCG